ncbi:MAG: metallophosphoesterase [Bacillota bacterium]|nr:metallophosphoesterase [Bacillota bacterium]
MRRIFAIADLHLGFSLDKPMEIFGEGWIDHHRKIERDWTSRVGDDDIVIVAGDISWGMRLDEAMEDLNWIDALPGKKVFIKGNHDFWWQSPSKMNQRFKSIFFLYNNYYRVDDVAICGTRGWLLPLTEDFPPEDAKIYRREIMRLERSLLQASQDPLITRKIVAMHYPPVVKNMEDNGFLQLIKGNYVEEVVYGHLHDRDSWENAVQGIFNGVNFHLVACDFLDFKLKEIVIV